MAPPLHVRPIEFGSPEYHAACELRRRFLREPLGLELTADDVAGEDAQHHFGLFLSEPGDAESLIGCLIGKPDADPSVVRLRQVVIHADWRGRGRGGRMLAEAERMLAERGYNRFVLYARNDAALFYKRYGYETTGDTAVLIGLEHLRMEKPAQDAG